MPLIRWFVPLADVQRSLTLRRIVDRLERGQRPYADLIALAKHLRSDLQVDVKSTD